MLSADETTLYDRQIRIWGVQAQQRLRDSRLLVVGVSGLTVEICKNIVLAGVGHLVLMDDQKVDASMLSTNCFISDQDIGMNVRLSSEHAWLIFFGPECTGHVAPAECSQSACYHPSRE